VLPRREVPVGAARAAFLGGQLTEDESSAGLSSFMAGMWMRGTQSRSAADFSRAVENLAADVDGFSGRNSVGFVLEATRDKLEPTLDLLAEVMLEPAFDAAELERERSETLAALARREDRLAQLALLQFTDAHYPSHPYRLPMGGTRESVERFDVEMLRRHHARLLNADNLVIAVAGDVDPDSIATSISVRLAELPSGGFELPSPAFDPEPSEIHSAQLRKERAQTHIVIGFRGLTVSDPDRYALEVISQLLAGQGGRLFLELRDRQSLAYTVSASNVEGVAPGFFSVYIATAGDKVEEAKAGLMGQLTRLLEEAPADDEFARAKRYLSGSFAIDQQRNAARAAHASLDGLYGLGPEASLGYAAEIESVSKEDLLRVARRVLRLDAYTISVVGDVDDA
jgi:zinc protease